MGDLKQFGLLEAGVNEGNFRGNALIYDLVAVGALDSVAQAVGSIDLEAARLVRLAQGIIRYRHNIIKEMIVFNPENPHQKERFHVSGHHLIFEQVRLATNRDTAEVKKARYEGEDDKLINEMDGNIDGTLLYDIQAIKDTELFLHKKGLAEFYQATNQTEGQTLRELQHCCGTSTYYLRRAQKIIRDKITRVPHEYICTSCGYYYPSADKDAEYAYNYPDPCRCCNSPAAWIVPSLA